MSRDFPTAGTIPPPPPLRIKAFSDVSILQRRALALCSSDTVNGRTDQQWPVGGWLYFGHHIGFSIDISDGPAHSAASDVRRDSGPSFRVLFECLVAQPLTSVPHCRTSRSVAGGSETSVSLNISWLAWRRASRLLSLIPSPSLMPCCLSPPDPARLLSRKNSAVSVDYCHGWQRPLSGCRICHGEVDKSRDFVDERGRVVCNDWHHAIEPPPYDRCFFFVDVKSWRLCWETSNTTGCDLPSRRMLINEERFYCIW